MFTLQDPDADPPWPWAVMCGPAPEGVKMWYSHQNLGAEQLKPFSVSFAESVLRVVEVVTSHPLVSRGARAVRSQKCLTV